MARRDALARKRAALDARLQRIEADAARLSKSAYLHTDAQPSITYMPRVHNDATRAKLRRQQAELLEELKDSPLMLDDPLAGLDDGGGEGGGGEDGGGGGGENGGGEDGGGGDGGGENGSGDADAATH